MTSAALDTRTDPKLDLPNLCWPREVLITMAAEMAAKSRAALLAHWLRVAATKNTPQVAIDTALVNARETASEFADFAILAGRDPERFTVMCMAEFGREIHAARALIRAEVVARRTAKVPA